MKDFRNMREIILKFLGKGPLQQYFSTRREKNFENGMWILKIRYFFQKGENFLKMTWFFWKRLRTFEFFFFLKNGRYDHVFWKTYASENSGYFWKYFWKKRIFFWKFFLMVFFFFWKNAAYLEKIVFFFWGEKCYFYENKHICTCIYLHISIHTRARTHAHMYVYGHMSVYMGVYTFFLKVHYFLRLWHMDFVKLTPFLVFSKHGLKTTPIFGVFGADKNWISDLLKIVFFFFFLAKILDSS